MVEGSWPGSVVLIEFPGPAEARAWYESPAYQEILRLCTDHIEGDLILVEGVGPGYDPTEGARKLRAADPEGYAGSPEDRAGSAAPAA
ncbi:hypothetical protein SPAR_09171 [Streptomyces sparsogenes DSM 40356]|uniref:DUF1330 domain-containing protein n=1 Tax=Streptomyces sparsogenes DSM 40356 TaxID=1331668 RepID=A0A1R1SNA2_9ACTN|nr:hypothetical protein SPAR_09171 [Streptomyces sparsogenes DSM 40356]